MSIAPVNCTVDVKAPAARAFELFAKHMGEWWPRGRTPGGKPHVDVVIEPQANGRWFEQAGDGTVTPWGRVLVWDPPHTLVLGWQLNSKFTFDPKVLMEVEIRFEPLPGGGTRVSLEHRNLEQLGVDAEDFAGRVRPGWRERLADFVQYSTAHV
jgi:hypothetical protein